MKRALTTLVAVLVAVGMLAGFAGPVAAQGNSADATVAQGQSNTQANSQNADICGCGNATVNQSNAQTTDQVQQGSANADASQAGQNVDIAVDVTSEVPSTPTNPADSTESVAAGEA